MASVKKGPPVRIVNLVVDPYRGVAALAAVMTIPGYVFVSLERRGIRAKLRFLREDLAGAA